MSQPLPSVSLYIRITDAKGRRYERVNRRNPQIATGPNVYCLHFYENGRRKWETVGTDINAASAARRGRPRYVISNAGHPSGMPRLHQF